MEYHYYLPTEAQELSKRKFRELGNYVCDIELSTNVSIQRKTLKRKRRRGWLQNKHGQGSCFAEPWFSTLKERLLGREENCHGRKYVKERDYRAMTGGGRLGTWEG